MNELFRPFVSDPLAENWSAWPVKKPSKTNAPNPATTTQFYSGAQWRELGDPGRSAS
jgi:hypothetical protein